MMIRINVTRLLKNAFYLNVTNVWQSCVLPVRNYQVIGLFLLLQITLLLTMYITSNRSSLNATSSWVIIIYHPIICLILIVKSRHAVVPFDPVLIVMISARRWWNSVAVVNPTNLHLKMHFNYYYKIIKISIKIPNGYLEPI